MTPIYPTTQGMTYEMRYSTWYEILHSDQLDYKRSRLDKNIYNMSYLYQAYSET